MITKIHNDANGNLRYQTDNAGSTVEFQYDKLNRLIKKVYYSCDLFEIKNGTPIAYIFAVNLRIAQLENSALCYFHKDHPGNSAVISRPNGFVREYSDYLSFGMEDPPPATVGLKETCGTAYITNSTNNLFTDQKIDRETRLYKYDARLYDPVMGRFVSADSVVPDWYDSQGIGKNGDWMESKNAVNKKENHNGT